MPLIVIRLLFLVSIAICSRQVSALQPVFDGLDRQRKQLSVKMVEVLSGLSQPTAVQFIPGKTAGALVLEKGGALVWVESATGRRSTVKQYSVRSSSELGLLGIALHPKYPADRRLFVHYNPKETAKIVSWVSSFELTWNAKGSPQIGAEARILELEQPFSNHDGGHLAFGPDGFLYIGFGDGGRADDPLNAGQDLETLLGKMLRIDIDQSGKPYGIPKDNPFLSVKGARPEIWAYGLRNPWRYSFAPSGELIVADVGQNRWEEVSVVERSKNYGWRIFEGFDCYLDKKLCDKIAHAPPRLVYGREDGTSITGGYVYQGVNAALKGHYLFGDFTSGRIWAVDSKKVLGKDKIASADWRALGKFPINVVAFAQDTQAQTYVIDYTGGRVYRLD